MAGFGITVAEARFRLDRVSLQRVISEKALILMHDAADTVVQRVTRRLNNHPVAKTIQVREYDSTREVVVTIEHDGPKSPVLRPVKKQALFWPGAAHPVAVVRHYKGIGPLIESEVRKLTDRDFSGR